MIKEIITSIEEICEDLQSGFEIKTDRQSINMRIDNHQSCCEHWGYFMTNDDTASFIGAAVLDVKLTDTELNQAMFKTRLSEENIEVFSGDVMFVNIETDRGTLQFVAFNEHNGYYGHTASVVCEQLTHSESL